MSKSILPLTAGRTESIALATLQKVDEDLIPELDEIPLVDDEGKLGATGEGVYNYRPGSETSEGVPRDL